MITYSLLQHYWWFLVSLLAGLLVFLLFVQGANSLIFVLGRNEAEQSLIVNSTGRKWELTFTTLVTFGGAFFASFPLFSVHFTINLHKIPVLFYGISNIDFNDI